MPVAVDDKRILTNYYSNGENSNLKTIQSPTITDKSTLSQPAINLKDLPLDLANSNFTADNKNFSFDFTFNENRYKDISVNGYYSSTERNLSMNMKFVVEKVFYEGETKSSKYYQIDFSVNSSDVKIESLNNKIQKENIYDFLNRVLTDITKILNDDSKNLNGIVFNKEDLAELMGIGDKEIVKLLREIFLMIQTMANIKKLKNPNAENTIYSPKRNSTKVIESNKTKLSSYELQMSIKEID